MIDREEWRRAFAECADDAWAQQLRCVPLYRDFTHAFGIDEEGNVHADEIDPWPMPVEMNRLLPLTPCIVKDVRLLNLALREGSKEHPWLVPLFPERPADAIDCATCKGAPLPGDMICACGGAGWLPNPGPPCELTERAPVEADLEELFRLHEASIGESVAATYGWDDADQRRRFAEAWEMRKRQRLLVDRKGAIIAAWHVERREADEEHFLTFVEVAPSHQGRGIGTWIVERFVEEAFRANADATLRVLKVNPRAKALYERLGFVVENETPTHHVMRRPIRRRNAAR